MIKGKEIVYYCKNPKKIGHKWLKEIKLNHEDKYAKCGFKATNQLKEFIKNVK